MSDSFVTTEEENWRLEQQSKIIRFYQDGKLLLCPFDLSRSNLRILDSASSDGYWLSQLQANLKDPGSCTLIGTDIQDRHLRALPPGISFQIQDILQPWPESWKSSFDLVHQTLVLTVAGPRQREAVNAVLELVKPGGWVELMEPDGEAGDDDGPAHQQFVAMMNEIGVWLGAPKGFSKDLEGYLLDAGFLDVKTVVLPGGTGPKLPDSGMREASIQSAVISGKNVIATGKRKTPASYPQRNAANSISTQGHQEV
ncbi:uncharacterized protein JN550_004163 [Neoarthrinium moseri]|uniref:uncharacterized protein n=1 Tax=Neoarthrinium moseri TaxID=1658444 RepID=UPI001FDB79B4|nr:uncharacterized protein JN550_004163 [Neoarthrinium moseri]KAI1871960.1 hypothetical protein JN550_004163 [Neoarthrinium moseri]